MRGYILFLLVILFSFSGYSQQGFNYQVVVRDADGNIRADQGISLAFEIQLPTGSAVYRETHTTITNKFGLANVIIGKGATADKFTDIDWGSGIHMLQVSIDGVDVGKNQLMSVPYALYALNAESSSGGSGVGIESTVDNGNGTFTLKYTDGTSFTTINLIGPMGPMGPNGLPGTNGKSAYQSWKEVGNSGTEADFIAYLIGPRGEQGIPGVAGAKGDKGDQGNQGIQGDKGDQGIQGIQGIQGEEGDKGDRGVGIVIVGSVNTSLDLDPSYSGQIGDMYLSSDDGHGHVWNGTSWDDIGIIQGPKGDTGDKGDQGDKGLVGDKGLPGDKGDKGDKGDAGDKGDPGERGPKGDIAEITGSASTIDTETITGNRALVTTGVGKVAVSAVTSTELGYLDNVTSNVQTQLDAKQATITGGASTIVTNNLTTSRVLTSNSSGKVMASSTITSTELGYLDGVTSNIQTQLDDKSTNITGSATTIDTETITASRALVTDGSGKVAVSAVTSTELGYLDNVTSNVQTQLDAKSGSITGSARTIDTEILSGTRAMVTNTDGTVAVSDVTSTELGYLDGVTSNVQTQLDAKQATITGGASTIVTNNLTTSRVLTSNSSGKVMASSTITSTELGYLDGVTSNIQTQLDDKSTNITGSATTIDTETITASRALVTDGSGKVAVSDVTSTELGYLDGVTSNVQTQLDAKSGSITGSATTIDTETITASRALVTDGSGKVAVSDVTSTELTMLDGGTAVGSSITVADTDGVILNDDGTMKLIPASDFTSYIQSATKLDDLSDVTVEDTDFEIVVENDASPSIYVGHDPSSNTTSAWYNIAIGTTALDAITTGDDNIAIGNHALTDNTGGSYNIGIGIFALSNNTAGNNVAVGYQSMRYAKNGQWNTAIGNYSLASATNGSANSNTAVGYAALYKTASGANNVAVGQNALYYNVGGTRNIAIGVDALKLHDAEDDNLAIGYEAMRGEGAAGEYNVAIGNYSQKITSGDYNISVGYESMKSNRSGTKNIAIGSKAYDNADTESNNLAIGYDALGGAIAGGEYNVAVGNYSLDANTSGDHNTAIGYNALTANTTGSRNTASGYSALNSNTTGVNNSAYGYEALKANTTGSSNTASGYQALEDNTTGSSNTAFGVSALEANTTGSNKEASGSEALKKNTTGSKNTAGG